MKKRTKLYTVILFAVGILISNLLLGMLLSLTYAKTQYRAVSALANELITRYPNEEQEIVGYIKEYGMENQTDSRDYLSDYGFHKTDFWKPYQNTVIFSSLLCSFLLVVLTGGIIAFWRRKTKYRVEELTDNLEKMNRGKEAPVISKKEDEFSILEDEISKTVTEMKIAKETAIRERRNFADHLENIAHQIKTPVTSVSVLLQLYEQKQEDSQITRIKKQVERVGRLIDTLITMAKIDAGILELKRETVDVYTLLELSAEALDNQIQEKQIEMIVPNQPDVSFTGDLDWSMEAFINLIKNSIEHTPQGGSVTVSYEMNALYTEITVMDNGEGFEEKEQSHMFERFYQGKNTAKTGMGIGLSLAKSIIEMQNGFILAKNIPSGGACFIVRFYCH